MTESKDIRTNRFTPLKRKDVNTLIRGLVARDKGSQLSVPEYVVLGKLYEVRREMKV